MTVEISWNRRPRESVEDGKNLSPKTTNASRAEPCDGPSLCEKSRISRSPVHMGTRVEASESQQTTLSGVSEGEEIAALACLVEH